MKKSGLALFGLVMAGGAQHEACHDIYAASEDFIFDSRLFITPKVTQKILAFG